MINSSIKVLNNWLAWSIPGMNDIKENNIGMGLITLFATIYTLILVYVNYSILYSLLLLVTYIIHSIYISLYSKYLYGRTNFIKNIVYTKEMTNKILFNNPWWWSKLIGSNLPLYFAIILFVIQTFNRVEFSLIELINGLEPAGILVKDLLSPKWELLPKAIFTYGRQTMDIALVGTFIGIIIAIPFSILSARNIVTRLVFGDFVYTFFRSIAAIIRATPVFLIGLFFVACVGLGPFPGALAITVFTIGIAVKLFSEIIENIDEGTIESITVVGGNLWHIIIVAVFPQVIKPFISTILYVFEINIHSATVLGLIGAQGIGLPIHEYVSTFAYREAAVFILVVIVMTVITDFSSAYVRHKIDNEKN